MQEIVYHTQYQLENSYFWFVARNQILNKVVSEFCNLNSDFNLLDVGCGNGGFSHHLINKCNVIGIDTSETALDYASKRGIKNLHNVILKDFDKTPYGHINAVTIFDVIEHIEDDKEVVSQIYDVLANDSYVFATVPAYQWLWSKHDEIHMHYRRYSIKNFKKLFQDSGFKIIYTSYFNSLLFIPAVLKRFLDKLTGQDKSNDSPIDEVSPLMNKIFTTIFLSERKLIPNVSLPFGLSILIIAKKY